MTVDDAVQMMGVLASLSDGTPEWVERLERLNNVLLETPERFFDVLWDELNPIKEETKVLIRSGAITTESTIGDMKRLFAKGGDEDK